MIGFSMRADPDEEIKSVAVAFARALQGSVLDWMREPLVELEAWKSAVAKQVDAENKARRRRE